MSTGQVCVNCKKAGEGKSFGYWAGELFSTTSETNLHVTHKETITKKYYRNFVRKHGFLCNECMESKIFRENLSLKPLALFLFIFMTLAGFKYGSTNSLFINVSFYLSMVPLAFFIWINITTIWQWFFDKETLFQSHVINCIEITPKANPKTFACFTDKGYSRLRSR